jgi:hypothetical protein
MAFVGYIVEIIGVVLLFLGTIGAARDTLAKAPRGFAGAAEIGLATLALQVFQQFLKSPPWLILLILGALLIVAGDRMATGAWFFNR